MQVALYETGIEAGSSVPERQAFALGATPLPMKTAEAASNALVACVRQLEKQSAFAAGDIKATIRDHANTERATDKLLQTKLGIKVTVFLSFKGNTSGVCSS